MKNDTKDINEKYYSIFGRQEYPTLFDSNDEEYNTLRQMIISAPHETLNDKLPFRGLRVPTVEECRLDDSVQRIRRKKKHIFFLKSGRSPKFKTNAAAYYDYSTDRFIVLKGSYCILNQYTLKLMNHFDKPNEHNEFTSVGLARNQLLQLAKTRIGCMQSEDYEQQCDSIAGSLGDKFQCRNGYVYLLKDLTFISADFAASFWVGRKTTSQEWKDTKKKIFIKDGSLFPGW